MLELLLAIFIFIGLPVLTVGYVAFIRSQEKGPDIWEDMQNWGSQDRDRRKQD